METPSADSSRLSLADKTAKWTIPVGVLAVFLVHSWQRSNEPGMRGWSELGLLELSQAALLLCCLTLAVQRLRRTTKDDRSLRILLGMAVLGSAYTLGEEIAWGQHFFGWSTPEFLSQRNDQNETGLHNMSGLFDQLPRTLLELCIFFGAIGLPLASRFGLRIRGSLSRFLPHPVGRPTAALIVLLLVPRTIWTAFGRADLPDALDRLHRLFAPGEIQEWFIYYFILLYLIYLPRSVFHIDGNMANAST